MPSHGFSTISTPGMSGISTAMLGMLFLDVGVKGPGVKQRFFNLHLLIKPNKPISGIRLSSGISHNRKRIYRIDASARFGLQQLFDNFHDLCQMAFSLTLFSGLPFWYVTMLSSRRPLPASSPLRTVRATFTAYRSNIS